MENKHYSDVPNDVESMGDSSTLTSQFIYTPRRKLWVSVPTHVIRALQDIADIASLTMDKVIELLVLATAAEIGLIKMTAEELREIREFAEQLNNQ